jgi:hypothetical protein
MEDNNTALNVSLSPQSSRSLAFSAVVLKFSWHRSSFCPLVLPLTGSLIKRPVSLTALLYILTYAQATPLELTAGNDETRLHIAVQYGGMYTSSAFANDLKSRQSRCR